MSGPLDIDEVGMKATFDARPIHRVYANTHRGHFPDTDTGEEGFIGTSPVMLYLANPYGLYDMTGTYASGPAIGTSLGFAAKRVENRLAFLLG